MSRNFAEKNLETISRFGIYQGYTDTVYDGTQRVSDYLALADETRLAYDLILPTKHGIPADTPLPVLFKYTPYLRTWTIFDKNGKSNLAELEALPWYAKVYFRLRSWLAPHGNILNPLWRTKWLGDIVKSGYALVVVERPGTGASFGTYSGFDADVAREANEILDWMAGQPWCDGNIGMYGDSAQAQVLPTAHQFSRGSHIRVTIACADADNFDTPILDPALTLQVLRNASHSSSIEIPIAQMSFAKEDEPLR